MHRGVRTNNANVILMLLNRKRHSMQNQHIWRHQRFIEYLQFDHILKLS